MLCQICYENLHYTIEVFAFDDAFYVIPEYMAISLNKVVVSSGYPDERQLVTIIVQVSQQNVADSPHRSQR